MVVNVKTADFVRKVNFPKARNVDESTFWKKVASYIRKLKTAPNFIDVECKIDGKVYNAHLTIVKRGVVKTKDGERPSFHVSDAESNIPLLPASYGEVELRCINSLGNNYKKYYIAQEGNALLCRYGSIDIKKENCRTVRYDKKWLFWPLYFEKLSKGYKDVTDVTAAGNASAPPPSKKDKKLAITLTDSQKLYEELLSYTKGYVRANLVNEFVTRDTVEKCKELLEDLRKKRSVKTFNKCLEELMLLCPRKRDPLAGDKVEQFLAKDKDDFPKIIDRESDLIDAMDVVAVATSSTSTNSFKDFGVHVWKATPEQEQEVLALLCPSVKRRVDTIYRVKPTARERRMARYIKENHVNKVIKVFHGTANPNVLSIMKEGVRVMKNAANGRMMGNKAYFAPDAGKSLNYTSLRGSTWAHGTSDVGFMFVHALAYGKVLVQDTQISVVSDDYLERNHYDCVHAKAGARVNAFYRLKADEIVPRDIAGVCENYLIKLKA